MAKENKTKETKDSVSAFIGKVKDKQRKADCEKIVKIYTEETGFPAKMWGTAIVGFGSYHYKYESGREGDAPLGAFSPRASSIVFYLTDVKDFLPKLGTHKASGGCIHIKKLEDIDVKVLKKMITHSMKNYKKLYK
jgi:hypothetical protein